MNAIISHRLWYFPVSKHVGDIDTHLSLPKLRHIVRNELLAAFSVLATALSCTGKKLNIYSNEVLNKLKKGKVGGLSRITSYSYILKGKYFDFQLPQE